MKKGQFLIIAFIVLAIGSGAALYASINFPDTIHVHSDCDHVIVIDTHELLSEFLEQEGASFTNKILVGGSQDGTCSRCNGARYVDCWNPICMYKSNGIGCGWCNNTGRVPCPKCNS